MPVPLSQIRDLLLPGLRECSMGMIFGFVPAPVSAYSDAKSEARSKQLLCDNLTPEQLAEFKKSGWFSVTGNATGTHYRIHSSTRNANVMVLKSGRKRAGLFRGSPETKSRLCFLPCVGSVILPMGDVILAQKIMLENDESYVLKIAARFSERGGLGSLL